MKFSIRDLLLVTVIVAILAAWWADRSQLAWTHSQTLATADHLRAMLDKADPDWRNRPSPNANQIARRHGLHPATGYAIGICLVGACILIIVLVWKKQIHPFLLEEHRRF
ncbi:MAG: hypothetical protein ACR2FY_24565 [Pirellulaceae bacterium]